VSSSVGVVPCRMWDRGLTLGRDEQPRDAFAQLKDVPRLLHVLWQHPLSCVCAHSTGNRRVFQRGDLVRTYDRRTFEDRRAPVKYKDGFYSPEEKLADATQEAENVSVEDHAPVIISHCGLELVDPYAGIYGENFSLQSF